MSEVTKDSGFSLAADGLGLEHPGLSLAAVGLLARLGEFDSVSVEWLTMNTIDGRNKIIGAANELVAAGLASLRRQRSEGGAWATIIRRGAMELTPDDVFDQLWELYPAHRRAARSACRAKFGVYVKAGVDPYAVLEGLRRDVVAWREAPEDIPQVTQWLVRRGWEVKP